MLSRRQIRSHVIEKMFIPLYVNRYVVTSHAARSNASNPLDILISAVVIIVVSIADMKRESQSLHFVSWLCTGIIRRRKTTHPATMTCSLASLIFGTTDDAGAAAAVARPSPVSSVSITGITACGKG